MKNGAKRFFSSAALFLALALILPSMFSCGAITDEIDGIINDVQRSAEEALDEAAKTLVDAAVSTDVSTPTESSPTESSQTELSSTESSPTEDSEPQTDSTTAADESEASRKVPESEICETDIPDETRIPEDEVPPIDEDGSYFDKENVALYIHTYGKLPPNYITKKEAEKLGWEGGSVERYAPGKAIGGSYFGNYEGSLPTADGREYHECDIDTNGASSRGAKRIVYSNDGLVYYTEDHYETFELLYDSEGRK